MEIMIPERYRGMLGKNKTKQYVGLMGLSVGKQDFMHFDRMRRYCEFMHGNFAYSLLVIGDLPKKYNIMALEGISEKHAELRTITAGNDLQKGLEKVTRDFSLVKVTRWKNIMNDVYRMNLDVLKAGYEQNSEFRESANEIVEEFLDVPKNAEKLKGSRKVKAIGISKDYLLDELAGLVSAPFIFDLPMCEVYPGRNELHEQVQERKFDFCKDMLIRDDRTFMEVYVR